MVSYIYLLSFPFLTFLMMRFNLWNYITDEERGCGDGEVRLQGGAGPSNGYVEFCLDRRWGGVCSDGWDVNDARVVCKQLGFQSEGMPMPIRIHNTVSSHSIQMQWSLMDLPTLLIIAEYFWVKSYVQDLNVTSMNVVMRHY